MADTKLLLTAVNIIASPREALEALKLKPTALLPLMAVVIANAAVVFAYYSQVDIAWVMETNLENAAADLSPAQREAALDRMENLSPTIMGSVTAVSVAVFLTIWMSLNAAYLAGISVVTDDGFRFEHWFAMICWCALPILFGNAASLANIFLSDATSMRPDRMNPLSISSLLDLDSAAGSAMRQNVQSLDITAMWAIALSIYAYHAWTRRNLLESALIVLAPAILIFGSIYYFTSS